MGLAIRSWRQWAAAAGRPVVQVANPDPEAVVTEWTATLARQRDLTADALAFLAARTGRPRSEFEAGWAAQTLYDLERFWETVPLDRARGPAAVCHWLTRQRIVGEPVDPDRLAGQLDAVLGSSHGPWRRVLAALAGLLPPEALPALLLIPPRAPPDPVGWVDTAARLLTSLASEVAPLPVALAVQPTVLAQYLHSAPESKAQALVREGIVPLSSLTAGMVVQRLQDLRLPGGDLTGPVRRLAADGASEELVRAFGEAVQRLREPPGPEAEDRARSAAERFLYERLESLPETAGQFELNAPLAFQFGTRDAEVDLLARASGLAIEIDGYYHFRDAEAYRRDRRKDWELQRRGYLVVRFLAEDVTARLEEVLDTILTAFRHDRPQPLPGRRNQS
jgi:hypothetical protein